MFNFQNILLKSMKRYIVYFTFFITTITYSQVNIEKYKSLSNILGVNGNLSFYISAKTGNTDVQEFGIDGRINYESSKYYTFLIGKGEYGWNKGQEYSNNALLHFRYIHKLNKIINPEFFTQINYNKKRLLNFRSLTGGGIRVTIKRDSLTNFDFGTAYMYEIENLDLDKFSIHPIKTRHHRWSNYLSFSSSLSNNSRLSIVVYAQPRFDNFEDIRLLSENHLGVNLTETLSLSVNFSLQYDSRPPDGVKDFDTNTKVGFTIDL